MPKQRNNLVAFFTCINEAHFVPCACFLVVVARAVPRSARGGAEAKAPTPDLEGRPRSIKEPKLDGAPNLRAAAPHRRAAACGHMGGWRAFAANSPCMYASWLLVAWWDVPCSNALKLSTVSSCCARNAFALLLMLIRPLQSCSQTYVCPRNG